MRQFAPSWATSACSSETECSESVISDGWEDKEPDIASLHGGRFSPYDGLCFPNFHYVEIEHIVARKEADESGMCDRPIAEREDFAADLLNLTFAPGSLNASKGKRDAGELSTRGAIPVLRRADSRGQVLLGGADGKGQAKVQHERRYAREGRAGCNPTQLRDGADVGGQTRSARGMRMGRKTRIRGRCRRHAQRAGRVLRGCGRGSELARGAAIRQRDHLHFRSGPESGSDRGPEWVQRWSSIALPAQRSGSSVRP